MSPKRERPACGVIDGDGHVLEPWAAWRDLPERIRPHSEVDAQGLDHVIIGGEEVFFARLGQMGRPGTDVSREAGPIPLEQALQGAFDGKARLADMDREGIDSVVLYPTIGLGFWALKNAEAAVALAQAYNDWLADYCSADPSRLFGAAMLPFQDPGAAVAELRRAREKFGFAAAFVRPNPCGGRTLVHPDYEPVWEAAEGLGVAIGIHEGFQPAVQTFGLDRPPYNVVVLHAVSHTFEQMFACAQLMACGVMERHPKLRFVFLESGGGWAPYWIERLDHQVPSYGGYAPEMKHLPSEYFARQCWISFELDEPTLPLLAPMLGIERVIWGSDYPHADSTFPGAVDALRETIAPLPCDARLSILGTNALALYGLEGRVGRG